MIGLSPLGVWAGSVTLSWYRPGLIKAAATFAWSPEIQHRTAKASVPLCVEDPSVRVVPAFVGSPSPNATRIIVSPALAGVDDPGYREAGPIRLKSRWRATTWPLTSKNGRANETASFGTTKGALEIPLRVTTT